MTYDTDVSIDLRVKIIPHALMQSMLEHSEGKSYRDTFSNNQSRKAAEKILIHYLNRNTKGLLSLLFGPCYSGKTLSAIKLARAAQRHGLSIAVAQPAVDRPGDVFDGYIQARNGERLAASSYSTVEEIRLLLLDKQIIIVNEFQFTPGSLQDILFEAIMGFVADGGCAVLAGLYYSSLRTVFPFSERIMKAASYTYELKAICENCGKPNAVYSQRLINGKPASANTPLFLSPSSQISYVPRCAACHIIQ